jgi:iron complex outermembrane recepter protein
MMSPARMQQQIKCSVAACAVCFTTSNLVFGQTTFLGPGLSATTDLTEIIVTARRREEPLKDVPIAVTVISGDALKEAQIYTVKDVAAYAPGLNINSDSVGRAFVSMRGIGTTLIDTVQPGVGIFLDGIYQPDTTYLNTPLLDVERVEVLRGPQGTLFGNNTLGGAINVVTRQPSNDWTGRIDAADARPDNFKSASGSISGPIINDVLQFRFGVAYHNQDGFQNNTLAGGDRNPLNQKSASGELRFLPGDGAIFTLNANYNRVFGGNVPYANSAGPRDYTLDVPTNVNSLTTIFYKGANLKGEFDVAALHTQITAVAAYNRSDASEGQGDGDFGPIDFLRASVIDRELQTTTAELRADTDWNSSVTSLLGLFANRYTTHVSGSTTIVPFALTIPNSDSSVADSEAIFGTVFWKIDPTLDIAAGLRLDHQKLDATDASTAGEYRATQLEPRITVSGHWTADFMGYASIARGVRGGGQNDPGAPNLIYRGDSVWTYELGTKFSALNRRLTIDSDIFYNSYKDFIGPNALAPSTSGVGFVAVDLNAGHVTSYGLESEATWKATDNWRLYENLTLLHARITNQDEFQTTTGYRLPGDQIPFVPNWNFLLGSRVTVPLLSKDILVLDTNVVAKGERAADSLDATSRPVLAAYDLVNGSLAWQHDALEIALFANNIFDAPYIESYLDKSLLERAGIAPPIAANLAIQGERRRYGLRAGYRF